MNNMSDSNGSNGFVNPVDKFEEAFMTCLSALTKEDTLTNVDKDEIRVDVEQGIFNVIESARTMESYFLKKRLEIAAQKPELLIKDDANELRLELIRKDELLKKNYEKISHWQSILSDVQAVTTAKPTSAPGVQPGQQPAAYPSGLSQQLSQGPHTPQQLQGPMTPTTGQGRPNTPGGVGRPQTPGTPGGVRMQTSTNIGFTSPIPQQQIGSPQIGPSSGLQGPLAYLEKTASGIGTRGKCITRIIRGTGNPSTTARRGSSEQGPIELLKPEMIKTEDNKPTFQNRRGGKSNQAQSRIVEEQTSILTQSYWKTNIKEEPDDDDGAYEPTTIALVVHKGPSGVLPKQSSN